MDAVARRSGPGTCERARIVLAVADGTGTSGTAREVGVSRPTVIKWRDRFAAARDGGLGRRAAPGPAEDGRRRGDHRRDAGAAAGRAGGDALVDAGCWAGTSGSGTRRWRGRGAGTACSRGGGRRSSSPPTRELEAKVRDVVGLYLNPPEKAIVLCVDEKSQIQALNRTAPILPLRPGLPERATHDYKRNGTTTLFAALEVATGKVTDQCYDRHGKAEFLDFLKKVAKAYPRRRAARRAGQLPHPQARRDQRLARPRTRGSRCTSPRPRGPG